MAKWHNALGEGGQRLTILSILSPAAPNPAALEFDRELSLREAIDEIFRLAGDDGKASVVLNVTTIGRDEPDFTTEQDVPLRELAERLYGSFGSDGASASVLRILRPGDDPFGGSADGSPGDTDDSGGGPLAAIRRLREAVHRLFGGSADQGFPPTVLSLLVGPPAADQATDEGPISK
jgi:hypothetical protein